jgi:hypothetical protein
MRWQSYGTRGMYPTIRVVTGEGSKKVARQGLLNIPIIRISVLRSTHSFSIVLRTCQQFERYQSQAGLVQGLRWMNLSSLSI